MNRKMLLQAVVFAVVSALAAPVTLRADDSAASIAAGGLVPRRETRIVMAKEMLRISDKKVVVDYDFRNDTDQDVTTEVAFPIPPYSSEFVDGPSPEEQSFQSFKLWVDGKPVAYESEATATLKDQDVTSLLKASLIDIPSFGHYVDSVDSQHNEVLDAADFSRLPQAAKDQLVKAGLFELTPAPMGRWTVHLQYHWTQTFPAHATVHIRHEYTPVLGFTQIPSVSASSELLDGFCADASFVNGLSHAQKLNTGQYVTIFPHWVDFILTSANTWQRPIEDFTLILERPTTAGRRSLISFCAPGNGKVEKLDADHFQVHLTNFVPAAELHIGFFDLPEVKATHPVMKK
jgi:hypothetical protein